jgi:hypothetical protein
MPPKVAKFPTSLKLGGDVTYAGRTLELSPDGGALVYGNQDGHFSIARGEKALTKLKTNEYVTATACALDRERVLVGFPDPENGAHVDVLSRDGEVVATFRLPRDAALHGCIASVDADAVVAWGWDSVDAARPHLWWWSLASPKAKPTALEIAPTGMVHGAAFVGSTLFLNPHDQLFAATPAGVTKVEVGKGLMPNRVAGARSGKHLLVGSAKQLRVLSTKGTLVHSFPPFLGAARLTPDGSQVVGYGMALRHQTVPHELIDAHPEWLTTSFIARFDAKTGERLGWGPITDAVDMIALAEGELIVTKSVKRIAFHPWKLVTENG